MAYLLEPTPLDPKFQKRLRPLRHHMLPVSFAFFLSLSFSQHAKDSHTQTWPSRSVCILLVKCISMSSAQSVEGEVLWPAPATLIQALPKPGCSTRSHPGLSLPKPPWPVFCPWLRSTHSTLYLPFTSEGNLGHLASSAHLDWSPTCPG